MGPLLAFPSCHNQLLASIQAMGCWPAEAKGQWGSSLASYSPSPAPETVEWEEPNKEEPLFLPLGDLERGLQHLLRFHLSVADGKKPAPQGNGGSNPFCFHLSLCSLFSWVLWLRLIKSKT